MVVVVVDDEAVVPPLNPNENLGPDDEVASAGLKTETFLQMATISQGTQLLDYPQIAGLTHFPNGFEGLSPSFASYSGLGVPQHEHSARLAA